MIVNPECRTVKTGYMVYTGGCDYPQGTKCDIIYTDHGYYANAPPLNFIPYDPIKYYADQEAAK